MGVAAFAVLDDLTFVGPPAAAAKAFDAFHAACERLGMSVAVHKCKILCPRGPQSAPSELQEWSRNRSVPIADGSFTETLGSVIGSDAEGMSDWVCAQAERHRDLFDRLPLLRSQTAMLLLRWCGVPRFNYLCRVLPPAIVQKGAEHFDDQVWEAFGRITGIADTSDPNLRAQAELPLSKGGLGLRRATVVSPLAYVGAAAQAATHISSDLISQRCRAPSASHPSIVESVATAITGINSELRVSASSAAAVTRKIAMVHKIAPAGAAFWAHYGSSTSMAAANPSVLRSSSPIVPCVASDVAAVVEESECPGKPEKEEKKAPIVAAENSAKGGAGGKPKKEEKVDTDHIQKRLTRIVEEHHFCELVMHSDALNACRIGHCAAKRASLWLTVAPIEATLAMRNDEYRRALRHMLGVAPVDTGRLCHCGQRLVAGHYQSCKKVRYTVRHNVVVDELSSLARFLNAQTVKCPATAMLPKRDADGKSNGAVLPAQVSAIEPDVNMQLVGPDRPIAVDVAVVYGEQSIAVKAVSAAKAKGWEAMEEAIAAHGIVRRNEKEKRHYVDAKTGVSATEVCNQNGYAFEPFIV